MTVALNHTIVHSRDPAAGAAFAAEILGLPAPSRFGHFHVVETGNGVSLDYMATDGNIDAMHYAFLVDDADFDAIFARLIERGVTYYADPQGHRRNEINTRDGGRGCYFADPNGHWLEILTRPYGSRPN
jgi:catechol 2,3-dioxygenase-like lactoylglutathione lyase family enzyme